MHTAPHHHGVIPSLFRYNLLLSITGNDLVGSNFGTNYRLREMEVGGGLPKETGIAVWNTQSTPISSTLLCTSDKNKMKRYIHGIIHTYYINKGIIICLNMDGKL